MKIRKKFKFEGAHIVRNCTSIRCSRSIHGHSYTVEIFISAKGLDCGGMLLDFGLLKGSIKEFIDSFDHTLSVWSRDEELVDVAKNHSSRYVIMPVSPSAENYALMFLFVLDKFLKATQFNNCEQEPFMSSVRVHETTTGYAEAFIEDMEWIDYRLEDITFSSGIIDEWSDKEMYDKLLEFIKYKTEKPFKNAKPTHLI
jgi:6-pyruvoyltetrahydropterin/6-carboxytetrahydropterin synthase